MWYTFVISVEFKIMAGCGMNFESFVTEMVFSDENGCKEQEKDDKNFVHVFVMFY